MRSSRWNPQGRFLSREGWGMGSNVKWNASVTLNWRKKDCLPSFLFHSHTTREEVLRGTVTNTTQIWGRWTVSTQPTVHGIPLVGRGYRGDVWAQHVPQDRNALTVSPGLTETATTTPGIGERRMLLVSSATFSSMNLFSSAASLVKMCTLYLKEKSTKEVKWWAYLLKQHFSKSGFIFKITVIV